MNKPLVKPLKKDSKELNKLSSSYSVSDQPWIKWRTWLKDNLKSFPTLISASPGQTNSINPYHFVECLTSMLDHGSTITCADGTACVVGFQAAKIKCSRLQFLSGGIKQLHLNDELPDICTHDTV